MIHLGYVILGGIAWHIGHMLYLVIDEHWFKRRKEKKFIKRIRVMFPDAENIEAITVASSNEEAIQNIERRLRDTSRTL
jgi:aspartate/glutamate racemase